MVDWEVLQVENVCDLYAHAAATNCGQLKGACIQYIRDASAAGFDPTLACLVAHRGCGRSRMYLTFALCYKQMFDTVSLTEAYTALPEGLRQPIIELRRPRRTES